MITDNVIFRLMGSEISLKVVSERVRIRILDLSYDMVLSDHIKRLPPYSVFLVHVRKLIFVGSYSVFFYMSVFYIFWSYSVCRSKEGRFPFVRCLPTVHCIIQNIFVIYIPIERVCNCLKLLFFEKGEKQDSCFWFFWEEKRKNKTCFTSC